MFSRSFIYTTSEITMLGFKKTGCIKICQTQI